MRKRREESQVLNGAAPPADAGKQLSSIESISAIWSGPCGERWSDRARSGVSQELPPGARSWGNPVPPNGYYINTGRDQFGESRFQKAREREAPVGDDVEPTRPEAREWRDET